MSFLFPLVAIILCQIKLDFSLVGNTATESLKYVFDSELSLSSGATQRSAKAAVFPTRTH